VFGFASKITGTITKGFEIASIDKDYQNERAVARQQKVSFFPLVFA